MLMITSAMSLDQIVDHLRNCIVSLDHRGFYVAAAYTEMAIVSLRQECEKKSDGNFGIDYGID